MSQLQSCPSKELLVTVLYGEGTPGEQEGVRAHVAGCAACREEFGALGDVRQSLLEWDAPRLPSHFRIVSEPPDDAPRVAGGQLVAGPGRWWSSRQVTWAGLAAAAVLVVGVAAGLANLDVTVGPDGLRVRTGRGHAEAAAGAEATVGVRPAAEPEAATLGPAAEAPWRAELVALEQRLRDDMNARVVSSSGPSLSLATSRNGDEQLLRRVQQLIDQSETRQQRNLALRVTELARDFDVQRKADFVQIQQGLGKIEGRAEVEAARTQQMMNYLVRTASTTPR